MKNEYEEAICEFLARKENLPIVLEIGDRIDAVIARLGNQFWSRVQSELQGRLAKAGIEACWILERDEDEDGYTWGIRAIPKPPGAAKQCFHFWFAEEEARNRYHIFQGVYMPERCPKGSQKAAGILRESLHQSDYRTTRGSVAWKYVRDFPSANAFSLAISDLGEDMAVSLAGTFWDFFDAYRRDVDRLNRSPGGRKT